uniref:Uncharacterized protein n=1 Tax=candidate division WWE3 bacterium TaxID=2053526 RepID=A0A7C4TJC5_UNCKA
MTIDDHLKRRLEKPTNYFLTEEDKRVIKFSGIKDFVYRKLTSTKFRKTSIDDLSRQCVQKAIDLNVSLNQPIKFTYPFGAYKTFRLPSFPEVDWAEFMAISYILRYIAPVAAAYEPGVELIFSSDDVVIELIDNYPREALDSYHSSFKNLINSFEKHLPRNIKILFKQIVPDIYSKDEYDVEISELYQNFRKEGLTEERKEKLKLGFDFNCMRNGKFDLTDQTTYEKALEDLMYWNEAYMKLSKRRAFVRGEDKIVIFSNKIPNAIDIGSTNVSKAKFWVGTGVFETDGELFYDRVLSPKQYDQAVKDIKETAIDIITMKNFKTVPTINKRLGYR